MITDIVHSGVIVSVKFSKMITLWCILGLDVHDLAGCTLLGTVLDQVIYTEK